MTLVETCSAAAASSGHLGVTYEPLAIAANDLQPLDLQIRQRRLYGAGRFRHPPSFPLAARRVGPRALQADPRDDSHGCFKKSLLIGCGSGLWQGNDGSPEATCRQLDAIATPPTYRGARRFPGSPPVADGDHIPSDTQWPTVKAPLRGDPRVPTPCPAPVVPGTPRPDPRGDRAEPPGSERRSMGRRHRPPANQLTAAAAPNPAPRRSPAPLGPASLPDAPRFSLSASPQPPRRIRSHRSLPALRSVSPAAPTSMSARRNAPGPSTTEAGTNGASGFALAEFSVSMGCRGSWVARGPVTTWTGRAGDGSAWLASRSSRVKRGPVPGRSACALRLSILVATSLCWPAVKRGAWLGERGAPTARRSSALWPGLADASRACGCERECGGDCGGECRCEWEGAPWDGCRSTVFGDWPPRLAADIALPRRRGGDLRAEWGHRVSWPIF